VWVKVGGQLDRCKGPAWEVMDGDLGLPESDVEAR
jgi:hypothetical protein